MIGSPRLLVIELVEMITHDIESSRLSVLWTHLFYISLGNAPLLGPRDSP